MNEAKKKNYKLILEIQGEKYEIVKDTLREIDYFTSCFKSKENLIGMLLQEYSMKINNYSIYIESSRGTKEEIIYYNSRPIAFEENQNKIMSIIKSKDTKEVKSYLETKYNIAELLKTKSVEELLKIPVYKLYHYTIYQNKAKYFSALSSLTNEYRTYRDIALELLDSKDMNGLYNGLSSSEKSKVEKECNDLYSTILPVLENGNFYEEISDEEQEVLRIVDSEYLQPYEKYEELSKLFNNDSEKCRYYAEKYEDRITGDNPKLKM